jgi:epoxyqueuosine reductase
MGTDLKRALVTELETAGAYAIRVADPRTGFEHAPQGRHPLDLMPDCRSVVVFAIAITELPDLTFMSLRRSHPEPPDFWTRIALDPDRGPDYNSYRISFLFSCFVIMKALSFLSERGFKAIERHHKGEGRPETPDKLCAYEAGLGAYGRSGLILHPELGNRMKLGVVLTDAPLEPDQRLEGFDPCDGCSLCVDNCPTQAYGPGGEYHGVWSAERCLRLRKEDSERHYACNLCWNICPAGRYADDDLFDLYVRRPALGPLKKAVSVIERRFAGN